MSFRVNTNIVAMNALRNLGVSGTELGQSINRLSTGLRINSAADDPAGLIASEIFRAQIGGLDQAIKNNQDAVNYAKTAEGALDEVNRLLRDARALAVASANTGTLTEAQAQANQNQLISIADSISRIANQTQFGTKRLLDGSAGVVASITDGANVAGISFTGNFNGAAITTNSIVTMQVTTAATKATVTGTRTFAAATTTVNAGSFTINGLTFSTSNTDTISDVVARINNSSSSTGVSASWTAGAGVVLTQGNYGSNARVDFSDSTGVLLSAAGTLASVGTDSVASVIIDSNGATAGGLATVTFDKGKGLVLRDSTGNALTLTENGNLTNSLTAIAQLTVGSAQFQIGANVGQTINLALGNFSAAQLGGTAVSGKNMSNLDLTSATGANEALQVIDAAITQVSESRGAIGSFQRNAIDSNIRSLGIAKENLAASESQMRDTDVAAEMTNFTRLQILQQAGMAVLAQANSAPQAVLALLR
jgi:flagellin